MIYGKQTCGAQSIILLLVSTKNSKQRDLGSENEGETQERRRVKAFVIYSMRRVYIRESEPGNRNMVAKLFNVEADVLLIRNGAGLQATGHSSAA